MHKEGFLFNVYNQNAIKNHEVKVDVQKKGFKVFIIKIKIDNKWASFI